MTMKGANDPGGDGQALPGAELRRWLEAFSQAPPLAEFGALAGANDAFTRFAEEFSRLASGARAPGAQATLAAELEALAQRFFARVTPPWPAAAGQGHEWAAALQAWSMQLAELARATASGFAARLRGPDAPTTLRATFDAWIDAAEAAFQTLAHSSAYADAQARLFNELVRARARQQGLIDQLARGAGLPTRREVDALYDELKALKAELAASRTAAPNARRPRRRPS